jgi:hypothetical protein
LTPGGLPFRRALLHVVDEEADVVDDRSLRAALALLVAEDEADVEARERDQRLPAGHVQLSAHRDEQLFIRFNVFRRDVPVPHRGTGGVVRRELRRCRRRAHQQRKEDRCSVRLQADVYG